MKIFSKKENGFWTAWPARLDGVFKFEESDRLKQKARAKVKARLLRLSCRGLCCWNCNSGLRKWNDDANKMANASVYISEYEEFLGGRRKDHFN